MCATRHRHKVPAPQFWPRGCWCLEETSHPQVIVYITMAGPNKQTHQNLASSESSAAGLTNNCHRWPRKAFATWQLAPKGHLATEEKGRNGRGKPVHLRRQLQNAATFLSPFANNCPPYQHHETSSHCQGACNHGGVTSLARQLRNGGIKLQLFWASGAEHAHMSSEIAAYTTFPQQRRAPNVEIENAKE